MNNEFTTTNASDLSAYLRQGDVNEVPPMERDYDHRRDTHIQAFNEQEEIVSSLSNNLLLDGLSGHNIRR
jgi:hypothetical protein